MSMEILMQYVTFALMAVGVLAFLTALITQVIKEMPGLINVQTNVVAFATALILTALAVVIACICYNITLRWYYIVAAVIASFIVYLVATGGWERVAEIWRRTRWEEIEPENKKTEEEEVE